MTEPVLREATAADDAGIAACIGEAFPDNPKARLDVLVWQYRDNPFGVSPSWVWDDGGRIVGHYTAYPMPYLIDGVAARAGNAVDAAIAPSHQGRRLFTPLAEALYKGCAANDLPLAICYASNPVAMRGVANAGVHWMPRLRTVVLAADDAWLGRRFHMPAAVGSAVRRAVFSLGRGAAAEEVAGVPDGIDALWQHTVRSGPVRNGVDRGEAWWRWRYEQSPLGPYRYFAIGDEGAAVVTVRDDFGGRFAYLLEFLARDGDAAKALLRAITSQIDGLSGVATIAVDKGPLHRLAKDAGMRTLPQRLEPKGAWYGFVSTTGGHAHLVHSSWHIGWGDLDHL